MFNSKENYKIYKNGNYYVGINLDTGTKFQYLPESLEHEGYKPEFAESVDMQITNKCSIGCPFCYADAKANNEHPDLKKYEKLFDSFHPYTEIAINGNDFDHPDLDWFLKKMKEKKVIVNVTFHFLQFINAFESIKKYKDEGYIKGIGISFNNDIAMFVHKYIMNPIDIPPVRSFIKTNKDIVAHIIAGKFEKGILLANIVCLGIKKLLVLGNKNKGRNKDTEYDIIDTKRVLYHYKRFFDVIAYDTLAIKQLDLKDDMTEEEYDLHYLGDDGTSSFYIDLCTGTYNISSSSNKEPYVIKDNESVDFMFKQIRTNMKY